MKAIYVTCELCETFHHEVEVVYSGMYGFFYCRKCNHRNRVMT